MAKGLSAAKAKKILTDGYVKGKPLTAKQRKYFGAIASGATPLKAINGGWLDKYQDGGSVPKAQTGVSTPIELDEVILKSVRKSPEWKAYRDSLNYYNKGEKFIKEGGAYDYLRERYKDPLKKDKYEKAINQKLEDEITEYGKRDYDYYKKGSAKRNVIQRDEHYGGGYEDGLHLFQDVYSAEDWNEPVVPLSDKIQPIEVLWGPESGPRPIYKKPTKPMDSYSSQLDSDGIEPYTQDLESLISGNIEAQPIYQHKPYNQNDKPIPLGLLQKMGIENPESQGFHYIKELNGNFKTMQTREAYRKDNLRPNNTEYKNGGWLDKYQTGGSLPGASGMMYSRTSGSPLIEPGKLKKAQTGITEGLTREDFVNNLKTGMSNNLLYELPDQGGMGGMTNTYISDDGEIDTTTGLNCINGVCQMTESLTGKDFTGGIQGADGNYVGNQTFNSNLEKEGYYNVKVGDDNPYLDFGDVVQASKFKYRASRAKNKRPVGADRHTLIPQHAYVVGDIKYDENKKPISYDLYHNSGDKEIIKRTLSQKDFEKRMKQGWKHKVGQHAKQYDGYIVNRYDPSIISDRNKLTQAETSREDQYESLYDNASNPVQPKDLEGINKEYPKLGEVFEYLNSNYVELGKLSDVPKPVFDQMVKYQIGLAGKETRFGDDEGFPIDLGGLNDLGRGVKGMVMDTSSPDAWYKDAWLKNANNVQSKYSSVEEYKEATKANLKAEKEKKLSTKWKNKEAVTAISNLSDAKSVGMYQQKEISKKGKEWGLKKSDIKGNPTNQFKASLALMIDNYERLKKQYPDKSDDELVYLAAASHNAPGKVSIPDYANFYGTNKDIDYVNTANRIGEAILSTDNIKKRTQRAEDIETFATDENKLDSIVDNKYLVNEFNKDTFEIPDERLQSLKSVESTQTRGWLDKYENGGNLPKAQNGIKEAISKYLGDPYKEAREFAENPDELANIDNMRHAQATRLTQEAIANKTGNIPLISDALGLLGSNALGIGHELTTLFGDKDKRDWSTKLQESGEDVFNNIFGSVVGALPMDNKTKDDVIKYASYNNMLPDGYVRGEQGEEDGLSENVYFKNEDNEVRRPEYKSGGWLDKFEDGGEVEKAQDGNFGGVNTDVQTTSGESASPEGPAYELVFPDDSNYDARYKETYEGGAFATYPNQLDEVVISSDVDYNKDIYYDTLTDQEKDLWRNDYSPIGNAVRRKAQTKKGLAEDALAIPGQLLQGALETAQAPQAAMVEGIEALRGNDYNFSNALPGSGTQRLPSQAFGFEDKPGWDLGGSVNTAMDIVADPSNLVGAGLYDDVVKLGLKATPKLKSIAKTFGKYSDDLIDRTKNISKFNSDLAKDFSDVDSKWFELGGFNKPDLEMNNIFSRILDKLPKKVRETYASRVKGITKASDLPRLDSSEFDILKNIDEVMTLRERGVDRKILLERALKSNLDDPILESMLYKNKKQLQSELDDLTSIDSKPKKVVGTLDSTEEGVEQAIENFNRSGVVQLNPDSGFSLNSPSRSTRPSVDIDTMVRNLYDNVDDVDNVVTGNVATKKSQINQAVTEIPNRVRQSKPAPKNSAIDVDDLSGQDLANISSYPYVKPGGYTEELVPIVKLGPDTSKRDYANMVKDARARVRMSTRGEIFTGSTDTSYQSYLPQLNEVFSSKMKGVADPIFLGYKPMNPMGNINRAASSNSRSVTRGINENIAAYLNNKIDTNMSKMLLPDDILRPFFQNVSGEVMLPQYGLRKLKKGGVIKDDMGQWAHPGEVTEISGNTMATHGYGNNPLYVVPDVGEPRVVEANTGTQTFPGATRFTEYPMAKNGSSLVELNQLTNFTNYNTPQPGGWLDKYN